MMKNEERYAQVVDKLVGMGSDANANIIIASMFMDIARSLAIIADVIEKQAGSKDKQAESEEE